jgi:hypothetical protein
VASHRRFADSGAARSAAITDHEHHPGRDPGRRHRSHQRSSVSAVRRLAVLGPGLADPLCPGSAVRPRRTDGNACADSPAGATVGSGNLGCAAARNGRSWLKSSARAGTTSQQRQVAVVAAALSRLIGMPATRWTGFGGSSIAVPGTSTSAMRSADTDQRPGIHSLPDAGPAGDWAAPADGGGGTRSRSFCSRSACRLRWPSALT